MSKRGFSLEELSIVLVIIGLIAGGILGATSLIRTARLNSVITKLDQYQTAMNAFKLEYNKYPGDFDEAEDYWGAANTDNGDGLGGIDTVDEAVDFWNHLGLAGIIAGSYNHTVQELVQGDSHPTHEFPFVYHISNLCSGNFMDCTDTGSWLNSRISANKIVVTAWGGIEVRDIRDRDDFSSFTTGISNKDAKQIDQKIDDDNPLMGDFMAPMCSVASKATVAGAFLQNEVVGNFSDSYVLTETDENCFFFYIMAAR